MKLRTKMTLSVLSVVLVLFSGVIAYIAVASSQKSRRDSEQLTMEIIHGTGNKIHAELSTELDIVQTIGKVIAEMDRTKSDVRDTVLKMLATGATMSRRTIAMWIAFEPNAFDGQDRRFAGTELYGKNGQFVVSFRDNKDGTASPSKDFNAELLYKPGEEAWYRTPLTTGKVTFTEPNMYTYEGGRTEYISSLCVPIRIDGKSVGVIGIDISLTEIQEIVAQLKVISDRSTVLLMSNAGKVIYAPKPEDIGKNIADVLKAQRDVTDIVRAIREGREYKTYDRSLLSGLMMLKAYSPVNLGISGHDMSINVSVPLDDMLAESRSMTRNTIIAAIIGLLLLGGIVVLIVHRVVKPIMATAGLLERAAGLDFTTDQNKLWLLKYKDEIGTMAQAYRALRVSLGHVFHDLHDEAEHFASSAQNLAALSQESVASMEEVRSAVDEVTRLSESNAAALEETNAAVEEVSQSANSTAGSAKRGAEAAARTTDLTRKAVTEVDGVVDRVRKVGERSVESGMSIGKVRTSVGAITDFVSTITGIADQTNLLALNAAIEAARAGDAGRGFAVVAEEVRKLAEEAGRAAQEVQKLITALENDTGSAETIIREMGKVLEETVGEAGHAQERLADGLREVDALSSDMQTIAAAAEEQSAAASEMANSVNQVVRATAEVVKTLSSIRTATGETASASENVAHEAQDLTGGVEKLRNILAMFSYDSRDALGHDAQKLGPGKNK